MRKKNNKKISSKIKTKLIYSKEINRRFKNILIQQKKI